MSHAIPRGNGIIFSLFPNGASAARILKKEWDVGFVFARSLWHPHDAAGIQANKKTVNESSAGAPETDVVVRVARTIVQVQRLYPGIAAIVPIAAADEPGPAL